MRRRAMLVLLAMLPAVAAADSNLNVSYVRTKDLDLIYLDELHYLVPHTIRTFTNSLNFQRKTFAWDPSEPTIVLLKDFTDYGGAVTYTVPHDLVEIDVAPMSHAFETDPATERLYTLMNHELVHVTQGDIANDKDRRWRHIFGGKVAVKEANPETLLYSYLTSPRTVVPRWWSEGGAVFMETWKDGGIGRAQGGYDEMVFRTMVRDHEKFFDPLGLASRDVTTCFQITADA